MTPPSGLVLPPRVTAYATARLDTAKPVPPQLGWAAAAVSAVVVVPVLLWRGGDPVTTPVAVAVTALVVVALHPLGMVAQIVLGAVVVSTAFGVFVGALDGGGPALLAVLAGAATGLLLLLPLVARRAGRRRLRTAVGAPPVDLEPRIGRDVGVLATWRDSALEYEAPDPDPDVVLDAVGRLGSPGHDYVSVYHGTGRLDVLRADGGLMVMMTDHRLRPDWDRHLVVSTPSGVSGPATQRAVGGGFPGYRSDGNRVVGHAEARAAVRTWVLEGVRDETLTWSRSTRSTPCIAPRELRETD